MKISLNIIFKSAAINDALPLKAAQYDAMGKLIYGASNLSCRQTECHFIYSCCGAPR